MCYKYKFIFIPAVTLYYSSVSRDMWVVSFVSTLGGQFISRVSSGHWCCKCKVQSFGPNENSGKFYVDN